MEAAQWRRTTCETVACGVVRGPDFFGDGVDGMPQDAAATTESLDVQVDLRKRNPKLKEVAETDLDTAATHVDLSENELPALPPAIGSLSSLRILDVSDNRLAALPDELGACSSLEELLLYKNQLKKLPNSLGQLSNLRVLNAFNNKLMTFPATLGALSSLEEVNAAANKLAVISDASVAGWTNVRVVNLYDNNLVRVGSLAPLTSPV